uniref:Uncharacterized protein n=1 Tax=Anguilla anguilla TaxID=7936 RepID=A0A0E9XI58_ANGAN
MLLLYCNLLADFPDNRLVSVDIEWTHLRYTCYIYHNALLVPGKQETETKLGRRQPYRAGELISI